MRKLLTALVISVVLVVAAMLAVPSLGQSVMNHITKAAIQAQNFILAGNWTFNGNVSVDPNQTLTGFPFDSLGTSTVTVCLDGSCDYTKICNLSQAGRINSSPYFACAVGSAIGDMTKASSTWRTIKIAPGFYDEWVAIDGHKRLHLDGSGADSTVIFPTAGWDPNGNSGDAYPTIAIGGSVTGDCVSSGVPSACCTGSGTGTCDRYTNRIELSNMHVMTTDFASPAPAISVGYPGQDSGSTTSWNNVYIHDMKVTGIHDALQWFGSRIANDPNGWPLMIVKDSLFITAADAITEKYTTKSILTNNTVINWDNYCEDPNAATDIAGTVRDFDVDSLCTASAAPHGCCSGAGAGACDERDGVPLEAGDASAQLNYYSNRLITFGAEGGCGDAASLSYNIGIYDPTQNIAWIDGDTRMPVTAGPDNSCTYTIEGVPEMGPCRWDGVDPTTHPWRWKPMVTGWGGQDLQTYSGTSVGHKQTCWHHGVGTVTGGAAGNDGSGTTLNGLNCEMHQNAQFEQVNSLFHWQASANDRDVMSNFNLNMIINKATANETSSSSAADGYQCFSSVATSDTIIIGPGTCSINNRVDTHPAPTYGLALEVVDFSAAGTGGITISGVTYDLTNGDGSTGSAFVVHDLLSSATGGVQAIHLGPMSGTLNANLTGFNRDPNTWIQTYDLIPGGRMWAAVTNDFASIAAGACTDFPAYLPSANAEDACTVAPAIGLPAAGSQFSCFVADDPNGAVTLRHCCNVGTCDPGSGDYTITLMGN